MCSNNLSRVAYGAGAFVLAAGGVLAVDNTAQVDPGVLGFDPASLSLGGLLSFVIRLMFVAAGLAALIFMLLGALSWITSGGNKENVEKAREKIVAAVVGIVLIVVVVGIAVTLEQLVFRNQVCLGLTCPVFIPGLLQ